SRTRGRGGLDECAALTLPAAPHVALGEVVAAVLMGHVLSHDANPLPWLVLGESVRLTRRTLTPARESHLAKRLGSTDSEHVHARTLIHVGDLDAHALPLLLLLLLHVRVGRVEVAAVATKLAADSAVNHVRNLSLVGDLVLLMLGHGAARVKPVAALYRIVIKRRHLRAAYHTRGDTSSQHAARAGRHTRERATALECISMRRRA